MILELGFEIRLGLDLNLDIWRNGLGAVGVGVNGVVRGVVFSFVALIEVDDFLLMG